MTTKTRKPLALSVTLGLVLVGALSACSSDDGGSIEDFCAQGETAFSGDALGDIDPTDGDSFSKGIETIADKAREVKAPSDIKDDWSTLVDAFDKLAKDTKGLDFSDTDDQKKLTDAYGELTTGKVADAQKKVSDFVGENCKTSS